MRFSGKKRTNRKEQIELLSELLNISKEHNLGEGMSIKIQFAICAAIFDYNPKISAAIKPGNEVLLLNKIICMNEWMKRLFS